MASNEKGFTLIELMVVILIIGILVALAIPVFAGTTQRARGEACKNTLRAIDGASAQFQAEFGVWPTSVDDLINTKYLKNEPIDPHVGAGAYTIDTSGVAHSNGPLDH
ncbi:MAG TPA: prepilin-type N-terminal cleavage/methylation domain-containing protein [Actinobacteria bacterium]|nr:prepilin-type N-terminal cleavage/methylation domain-containing protein [Actinomycetota bacterium]